MCLYLQHCWSVRQLLVYLRFIHAVVLSVEDGFSFFEDLKYLNTFCLWIYFVFYLFINYLDFFCPDCIFMFKDPNLFCPIPRFYFHLKGFGEIEIQPNHFVWVTSTWRIPISKEVTISGALQEVKRGKNCPTGVMAALKVKVCLRFL